MKNKFFYALLIMITVISLSSCGKIPQAKIDATKTAIEAAVTAEAPIYLPNEFKAVNDLMTSIDAQVEKENSKLFKKFGTISVKLDSTLAQANRVVTQATAKKLEVKSQVETMMAELTSKIADNKTLLLKAPKGKDGAIVITQMKSELSTAEESLANVKTVYDNGKYMDALITLTATKDSVNKMNVELTEAIAKRAGRR